MEKAAKDFKKCLLNWGKSPYIVLDDVDVEEAANATTKKLLTIQGKFVLQEHVYLFLKVLKKTT